MHKNNYAEIPSTEAADPLRDEIVEQRMHRESESLSVGQKTGQRHNWEKRIKKSYKGGKKGILDVSIIKGQQPERIFQNKKVA